MSTRYIAKTNGATSGEPLIVRRGQLEDIAVADRDNWRVVNEPGVVLGPGEMRTVPTCQIEEDGSVTLVWGKAARPDYWVDMTLREKAAEKRWRVMTEGTTFNGMMLDTTDGSLVKIIGALKALEDGVFTSVRWKTKGGWVNLDLTAMRAVHQTVSQFIQDCYDAEEAVVAAIEAGTITTEQQVEDYSWPT